MSYNTTRIYENAANITNGDLLVSSTPLAIMSEDDSDDDCDEGCFFIVIGQVSNIFGTTRPGMRILRQESGSFSLWPIESLQSNFKKIQF